MADVFVSYRHGDDDHAKLVELELGKAFYVFQDTTGLRAGDRWGEVLERELNECRVFVAVIGRKWVSRRSLERLADPRDWVRKEILAALARPGLRIAPVLVGGAEAPKALPAEIRPLLAVNQYVRLRAGRDWVHDAEGLRSELLAGVPGAMGVARDQGKIPPVLPQLCDRVEPEDAFVDRVAAAEPTTRTFAFVLRGHHAERHGGFIERLTHKRVLDEVLRASATGVELWRLDWNAEYARQGRFDAVIAGAIKKTAMGRRLATDAELLEFLASRPQPQVFVLQVTADDCRACGPGLVPGLLGAWDSLAGAQRQGLAIASRPLVFWINLSCEVPTDAPLPPELERSVLELHPLEQRHIDEWLEQRAVKDLVQGRAAEVRRLPQDQDSYFEPGKLHMQRFEERVLALFGQG